NGYYSDSGWRSDHATYTNGQLTIQLDSTPCQTNQSLCSNQPLASTEVRTNALYGYGTLEARLKPAKGEGLVTAFFKYTGPSDGNPADEVDFEFLGNDTTKVQLNYFTAGQGGHEVFIDLGFDAADDFHTYTIRQTPDEIEWLVDGISVHTVNGPNLPSYPGRIMLSLWAVDPATVLRNWAGTYRLEDLPKQAVFDYVTFTEEASSGFDDLFNNLNFDRWHLANGWYLPYWSDNYWRADHIKIDNGEAILTVDDIPCASAPTDCKGQPLASPELRSNEFYGYGYVEGELKVAKGDGLITALFKYTGPSDGNEHQEIDFEFLGNDTTRVQLNYFVNGEGSHETFIDLGFDASAGYHTYGINHTPTKIEWYIDGQMVHRVSGQFPDTPARLMVSVWVAAKGTVLENWA
ncbi:unnamed protein product, partial [Cyprideis torosa]